MKTIRFLKIGMYLGAIAALACLSILFFCAAQAITRVGEDADKMTASVERIEAAVTPIPADLSARADALGKQAIQIVNAQATGLRADAMASLRDFRIDAKQEIGDTLTRADAVIAEVHGLRSDLLPVIDGVEQIEAHTDKAIVDLHPQLLGLVAASKVTMGESAQTMRTFQAAVPRFIAQGDAFAANANIATAQFAGIATNINKITKPKWYDRLLGYGLSFGAAYRDLNPGFNAGQAARGFFTKTK